MSHTNLAVCTCYTYSLPQPLHPLQTTIVFAPDVVTPMVNSSGSSSVRRENSTRSLQRFDSFPSTPSNSTDSAGATSKVADLSMRIRQSISAGQDYASTLMFLSAKRIAELKEAKYQSMVSNHDKASAPELVLFSIA